MYSKNTLEQVLHLKYRWATNKVDALLFNSLHLHTWSVSSQNIFLVLYHKTKYESFSPINDDESASFLLVCARLWL